MNIQNNSIIDSIIEYANVKFGMELDQEKVSAQIKLLHFSDILELSNAINNDDDDTFSRIIDLSALNEGYGTAGTLRPSMASTRKQGTINANAGRRNDNISMKNSRYNGNRSVAGGNKTATGRGANMGGGGPGNIEASAQQNSQRGEQNAQQSQSNSQQIQQLHDMISQMRGK